MGKIRILAAGALAVLGLSALAPVASAHDNQSGVHSVRWGSDAPRDGDRLFGTDFISASAHMNDGVKKWRIEMKPESGAAPFFCETDVPGKPMNLDFQCDWDTTKSGSVVNGKPGGAAFSANGRYVVTVTVWNVGSDGGLLSAPLKEEAHVLQPTRTVIVENPVSAPTGVVRAFDSGSRTATVTWNANPEPDIEKYVIQETADAGKNWTKVGERPGGSTSFQRPVERPGTFQYRVAAVRPGTKDSGWSVTDPLEVAPAPETPTTIPAGESRPSGDGDPAPFVPGAPEPVPSPPGPATTPGPKPAPGPKPGAGFASGLLPFRSPTTATSRPQVTTTTEFDPGYSETLPYKPRVNAAATEGGQEEMPGGEDVPQTMTKIVRIPRPRDPRALLIPLAAGLALFVFSMQVTHLLRRRPALVEGEDDFSDWMGGY